MTDIELRELDCWIAEHFMGWRRLNLEDSKAPSWEVLPKSAEMAAYPYARVVTWESTSFSDAFQPSSLPAAFALVKREIERRGWEWDTTYERQTEHLKAAYLFRIHTLGTTEIPLFIIRYAESEELAGCIAVKVAVEVSQNESL